MSSIQGKVGPFEMTWKAFPSGPEGVAEVEVRSPGSATRTLEVRWRRDRDGLWLELPHGVYGFDLEGEANDEGRTVYYVTQRGASGSWKGLSFLRSGEEATASAAGAAKKGVRVRAQMPGKIIRVMTRIGEVVQKDQPLLVMEAMKMENEIRAAHGGKVAQLKVSEGQAVETGADLCMIEPV